MFAEVTVGGDVYILSRILHDWGGADSVRILARCRAAMRPDGTLLVVEAVVPTGNAPSPGKISDVQTDRSPLKRGCRLPELDHELGAECAIQPVDRAQLRVRAARLQASDGRLVRPHPAGKLRLRQSRGRARLAHQQAEVQTMLGAFVPLLRPRFRQHLGAEFLPGGMSGHRSVLLVNGVALVDAARHLAVRSLDLRSLLALIKTVSNTIRRSDAIQ